MKNLKKEMSLFVFAVFIVCLSIWAFFFWLTPEYPLDQKEMTVIVACVAVVAFFIKKWQANRTRKQKRK
ncbi:hypothetical protein KC799_02370 [candidate division KSB1 bacterium]|nr:hypothetical protein [candidate division KSB1 bacterium]